MYTYSPPLIKSCTSSVTRLIMKFEQSEVPTNRIERRMKHNSKHIFRDLYKKVLHSVLDTHWSTNTVCPIYPVIPRVYI